MSKPTNQAGFEDNRHFEHRAHRYISALANFLAQHNVDEVLVTKAGAVDWTTRAPVNTAAPSISGDAEIGANLTADVGDWTGAFPITFEYQWFADDAAISGAESDTLTLTSAEEGAVISVVVTATNDFGSASAQSAGTDPVIDPEA